MHDESGGVDREGSVLDPQLLCPQCSGTGRFPKLILTIAITHVITKIPGGLPE